MAIVTGINKEGVPYIEYDVWYKTGDMMYRRDALDANNPEQVYNYLKANGIEKPEDYGIYHPIMHDLELKYGNYSKEQLLSVIAELKIELRNTYNYI